MKPEHVNPEGNDDPILDACLSEVLGGHAPPDLATRIVGPDGRLITKTSEERLNSIPQPPPVVSSPPAIVVPATVAKRKPHKQSDQWSIAAIVAVAASFIGLVIVIGLSSRRNSPQPQIAKAPVSVKSNTS